MDVMVADMPEWLPVCTDSSLHFGNYFIIIYCVVADVHSIIIIWFYATIVVNKHEYNNTRFFFLWHYLNVFFQNKVVGNHGNKLHAAVTLSLY